MQFSSLFSAMFRTSTCVLLLFSVLWLTSCDDEPEADKVLPELTVSNLADNATVWDVVNISAEASDDRGIDKVEIFVDGSLVKSLTEAPFSADWDTNSLTDGAHTVKVVATDKAGNNVEKEITVTVKNILVSFQVSANHLWIDGQRTTRGFVFLSDADGKLIKSVEFQNNQNVEIKAPGFTGETFYLTQAFVVTDGTENYPYLWTYAQVERGKWTLMYDGDDENDDYTIQAKLNYSNAADEAYYSFVAPHAFETGTEGPNPSSIMYMLKSPVTVYATRFPNAEGSTVTPAYRMFTNIVAGNNAINLAQITAPMTKRTVAVPADAYAFINIAATLVANDFTDAYYLNAFNKNGMDASSIDTYLPGTAFATYYAEAYAETDTYILERGINNMDQISFSLPQYQGDVVFSNNKISSSITGNFDLVSISFENATNNDEEWAFIFPTGANVSLPVPELPEALKNFGIPAVTNPTHFWLYEYENVDGYSGFKTYIRNSSYGPGELMDKRREYINYRVSRTSSTSGRTKKHAAKREPAFQNRFARKK